MASISVYRSVSRLVLLALIVCFVLLDSSSLIEARGDLYEILGIKRDATDAQIKKAYRKLSLKYHPDKNQGDEEINQKYLDIQYAHEILSDEMKRQTYDIDGEEGLKAENQPQRGGGMFDMFGMQQGGGKRKGPDFRMNYDVTLEALYNGDQRVVKVSRNVLCKSCRGTGAKDGQQKSCHVCGGSGQRMTLQQIAPGFNVQMQSPCDRCGGRGKTAQAQCPVCGGQKVKMEEKALDLVIERGMKDGDEITFERASEQAPDTIPGDVIMVLKQQQHPRFTRKGSDLHMTHTISLYDALLGFTFSFPHLDAPVQRRVTVTEGEDRETVQPEQIRRVPSEGMPQHEMASERGDLFIKYNIQFPKKFDAQQIEAIKALLS